MSNSLSKLEILFEDNHLLVLNKPAGWIVQGAQPADTSLLEEARKYIGQKYNKPGNVYLGVVSRLDRPVTGVVPFARTSKSAARLSEQFKNRSVEKGYWAIVQGDLKQPEGTLHDWLTRDEIRAKTRCHQVEVPHSSEAILHYQLIGSGEDDLHWIEIELETGRKHQIRAQLAAIGCPILGDQKYGSQTKWYPDCIALHCRRMVVQHPTLLTTLCWEASLPEGWLRLEVVKKLGLAR
jgi:23S rRNA pseudouridine1911/1915/1917 synthase